MEHSVPPGLDPNVTRREIVIEADAETLEKMRKEGHAKVRDNVFTIYCDEGANLGGDDSAPPPLAYFCTVLAFWLLTQIGRYGHMMTVAIDKARVYVTARFKAEGSVLAQTVRASLDDVQTRLEVESKAAPDRVAGVVRNAENGCFVMQALLNPVPVSSTVALNGSRIDLAAYPPPSAAQARSR